MVSEVNKIDSHSITDRDIERIGECAEKNAGACDFKLLGMLCEYCSVSGEKNVPRNCAWVRKD